MKLLAGISVVTVAVLGIGGAVLFQNDSGTARAASAVVPAPTVTRTIVAKPTTNPRPKKPAKSEARSSGRAEFEGDRLPTDSQFALPPIVIAKAQSWPRRDRHKLERRVLRYKRLALSPSARRNIRLHRVSAGALKLLLAVPKTGTRAVVWKARGQQISVQEQRLWMARDLSSTLRDLPKDRAPISFRLRPVSDQATLLNAKPLRVVQGGSSIGERVVQLAIRWKGTPYAWGGGTANGPTRGVAQGANTTGFDCSGLTLWAYAQVGISLDHYAAFQFHEGRRIVKGHEKPGDLVFFEPLADGPGHVGIYVGRGLMINAPHTGAWVSFAKIDRPGYMGAVRPYE